MQWKLLATFLILGLLGAAAYAYGHFNRPVVVANRLERPAGSSGFVAGGKTVDVVGQATDTWAGWTGAQGAALGFGFVGGFIVGFIFRAFIKLMMLITLVVVGGLAALSYFNILNVDFTAARQAYETNTAWLTDQAGRLKDLLVGYLPSSTGGAAGVFFGLRRK